METQRPAQIQNVTDALRKSNSQLQDLVDNTSDLIQLMTLDGRFLFVNKAWLEALDYEADELTGLRFKDIVWDDAYNATMNVLKRIEKGEKIPDFETIFKSKANKKIYLNGSVTCRYEDGKPTGFRCILHDISSRVRAERGWSWGRAHRTFHRTFHQWDMRTRLFSSF